MLLYWVMSGFVPLAALFQTATSTQIPPNLQVSEAQHKCRNLVTESKSIPYVHALMMLAGGKAIR